MWRVMIVEDEPLVRRGIIEGTDWASMGCEIVAAATNGQEALEAYDPAAIDLIFTDIKMPVMDGLELIAAIRQRPSDVPIVLLTAYEDFDFAKRALQLGVEDYLLKPFKDEELEATVARIQARYPKEAREVELDPLLQPLHTHPHPMVRLAYAEIAEHYGDPTLTMKDLADSLAVSESHLSHLFKEETGHRLHYFLRRYRLCEAKDRLKDPQALVYDVADQVGYRDLSHFSSSFKQAWGMTPRAYQKEWSHKVGGHDN